MQRRSTQPVARCRKRTKSRKSKLRIQNQIASATPFGNRADEWPAPPTSSPVSGIEEAEIPLDFPWRRGGESNPRIGVLQTPALPLGYPAIRFWDGQLPRVLSRVNPSLVDLRRILRSIDAVVGSSKFASRGLDARNGKCKRGERMRDFLKIGMLLVLAMAIRTEAEAGAVFTFAPRNGLELVAERNSDITTETLKNGKSVTDVRKERAQTVFLFRKSASGYEIQETWTNQEDFLNGASTKNGASSLMNRPTVDVVDAAGKFLGMRGIDTVAADLKKLTSPEKYAEIDFRFSPEMLTFRERRKWWVKRERLIGHEAVAGAKWMNQMDFTLPGGRPNPNDTEQIFTCVAEVIDGLQGPVATVLSFTASSPELLVAIAKTQPTSIIGAEVKAFLGQDFKGAYGNLSVAQSVLEVNTLTPRRTDVISKVLTVGPSESKKLTNRSVETFVVH